MAIRQTRIYAPARSPYDNNLWAETMMARIVTPMVHARNKLKWFWFTRYSSIQPEFGDSDETKAPAGFFDNNPCRSIRFRFEISDDDVADFERSGSQLFAQEGCWSADWHDYGIGELCSDRFIGEVRSQVRRDERLIIVKQYVESISRLALHALVSADEQGRFRFEQNDNALNPLGSTFFSLHHLFCNPTEVLLTALVASDGTNLQCGTRLYPPSVLEQFTDCPFIEFRVRY